MYMETQGTSNSQNNFERKSKAVKHPDFEIYNEATINKTVWH